jgi:hypothetical protein
VRVGVNGESGLSPSPQSSPARGEEVVSEEMKGEEIWILKISDYMESSPASPSLLAGEGGGEGEHIL